MNRKKRGEDHIKGTKPSSQTLITLDIFRNIDDAKSPKPEMVDAKRHKELEKEYLKLRKQIVVASGVDPEFSDQTKRVNKDTTVASVTPQSMGAGSVNNLDVSTISEDMFKSDTLGINHFKKHILNVKASSKRYKRALRGTTEQKSNKRVQFNFKPVYERKLSEDSLRSGPLDNSYEEGHS